MKRKLYYFIRHLFKVPDNCYPPKWMDRLFYPVRTFLFQNFDYDPFSDSVYIYKQRISIPFLILMAGEAKECHYGKYYKIDKGEDGEVIIHSFYPDKVLSDKC